MLVCLLFFMVQRPPHSMLTATLIPYPTLFRSGVSFVNEVSVWLELTIWRDGEEHWMRFRHGDAEAPLKVLGPAPEGKKGTKVTFLPSSATFKVMDFDFEKLEHRFRELAFLTSAVQIGRASCRERVCQYV